MDGDFGPGDLPGREVARRGVVFERVQVRRAEEGAVAQFQIKSETQRETEEENQKERILAREPGKAIPLENGHGREC